jgi:hypothetical protein
MKLVAQLVAPKPVEPKRPPQKGTRPLPRTRTVAKPPPPPPPPPPSAAMEAAAGRELLEHARTVLRDLVGCARAG